MPTKPKPKDPIVAVQVSREVRDSLKRLAADEGRTVSSYLRIVLQQHVARRSRRVA